MFLQRSRQLFAIAAGAQRIDRHAQLEGDRAVVHDAGDQFGLQRQLLGHAAQRQAAGQRRPVAVPVNLGHRRDDVGVRRRGRGSHLGRGRDHGRRLGGDRGVIGKIGDPGRYVVVRLLLRLRAGLHGRLLRGHGLRLAAIPWRRRGSGACLRCWLRCGLHRGRGSGRRRWRCRQWWRRWCRGRLGPRTLGRGANARGGARRLQCRIDRGPGRRHRRRAGRGSRRRCTRLRRRRRCGRRSGRRCSRTRRHRSMAGRSRSSGACRRCAYWCGDGRCGRSFCPALSGAKGQHAQQGHGEAGVFIRRQADLVAAVHGDLVIQLHLLRLESPGQAHDVGQLGQVLRHGARHRLRQRNPVQQGAQVLQRAVVRQAAAGHLIGHRHQVGAVLRHQRVEQAHQIGLVERAEHALHRVERDLAGRIGDRLVGQRQRVAHRAVRALRQQAQRRLFEGHLFLPQDVLEVADDMTRRHLLEVELEAARQHRHRDLLRIGGRQDELDVRRRLFERLEHRIERVVGEHVHLVDHIDLEARIARRIDRLFQQLGHLVHATVGCRIHLDVVDETAGVDRAASLALSAWLGGDPALPVRPGAIERLGQDARQRGLADPARAREQISVVQPLRAQGMGQRTDHVLLANQRFEVPGTVFAGEDLIGHATILPQMTAAANNQRSGSCATGMKNGCDGRADADAGRQEKGAENGNTAEEKR